MITGFRSFSVFVLTFMLIFMSSCSTSDKKSNKKSPDDKKADLHYAHGTSKLISKDYTEALDHLLKANEFRGDDSKICNNLGMAYYFKKQYEKATYFLKKSLESDSKNSDARNNLASLYFQLKKYKLAKEEYLEVAKDLVYEHQYRTYYNLGLISFVTGMDHEASDYFKLSLNEKNDYCPSHFQLGEIARKQGKFSEAKKMFKASMLGTCMNFPAPHYHYALSLIGLGDYNKAKLKLKVLIQKFEQGYYVTKSQRKLNELKKMDLPKKRFKSRKKINNEERLDSIYDVPTF